MSVIKPPSHVLRLDRPLRPFFAPRSIAVVGATDKAGSVEHLGTDSVDFRYLHLMALSERVAHERLTRACFIDYAREMALVAESCDEAGRSAILAVARLINIHGTTHGELRSWLSMRDRDKVWLRVAAPPGTDRPRRRALPHRRDDRGRQSRDAAGRAEDRIHRPLRFDRPDREGGTAALTNALGHHWRVCRATTYPSLRRHVDCGILLQCGNVRKAVDSV